MAAPDIGVLTKVAISKLTGTKPKGWDTDARELFDSTAKSSYPDAQKDMIEGAWRDGLAYMRENFKDEWDVYVKSAKRPDLTVGVTWDKVKLIKGQADGDTFELHFDVDGLVCAIECTDVQLLDPAYIQRKLVMYTRKDVSCPYLGKKQLEAWRRNVVLPWLKSAAFKHTDRETIADVVEGLIREFCSDTVTGETGPEVWMQLKRPVLSDGIVYVPFAGLQEFISRRAGNEPSKKAVKNTLHRMGFAVTMKGKSRLRFHSLPTSKLYEENIDPSEAGGGEVNADRAGSRPDSHNRRDGVLDIVRTEERDRSEIEGGEWPSAAEAPGGTPDVPDDPFAALS